ncbi:alkaline phosphatase D family protein [Vasconcelosia minhoensis]|uniref:alkaline phosphatase D family protein n=1 Tax=Vasconcelosia minhoensis TaxID=3366354 RepID=UPI001D143A8C|nr:alkaline phosphatase D family protein [Romeria gracilis]
MSQFPLSRRQLFKQAGFLGGAALTTHLLGQAGQGQSAPSLIRSEAALPGMPYGVASGDVTLDSAVIWSKSDRAARMWVEYATDEGFSNPQRVRGPATLEVNDYAAKVYLSNLPEGEQIFYRVSFQDLANVNTYSAPVTGSFRTIRPGDSIKFAWSGDTAGQGWGINPEWGGMKLYAAMRQQQPNFFIHCGDYIYADGPMEAEVTLADGSLWRNLVTTEKSKVAETLQEFRGNYQYNLMDDHVRQFNAEVAHSFGHLCP